MKGQAVLWLPFPTSRIPAVNVACVAQRSPLRCPGGKTWLIPHICEWLTHANRSILMEPFAGGGIVSLTAVIEDLVDQAVMIEIDRDVAAFWHPALRNGGEMVSQILGFAPTRKTLREWERTKPHDIENGGFSHRHAV